METSYRPPTIAALAERVATATGLGMSHIQITLSRSRPPGARMRLYGRTGPWSDHLRKMTRVSTKAWSAWWRVDELNAWLDTQRLRGSLPACDTR